MDDGEISSSSLSSCSKASTASIQPQYVPIQRFPTIKVGLDFVSTVLPKSIVLGSAKCLCIFNKKSSERHYMHRQTRICKETLCKNVEPDKTCPIKYKVQKCEECDTLEVSKLDEHASAEVTKNFNMVHTKSSCVVENGKEEIDCELVAIETPKKAKPKKVAAEKKLKEKVVKEKTKKRTSKTNEQVAVPENTIEAKKNFVEMFTKGVAQVTVALKEPIEPSPKTNKETELATSPQKTTPIQATIPKKSAFDFLMNKKKSQLLISDSNNSDSDNCIVLDTSSVCDSPRAVRSPSIQLLKPKAPPVEKHIFQNFVNEPYFLTHCTQYSEADKELLHTWNTNKYTGGISFKTSTEFDLTKFNLNQPLNMEFQWNPPANSKLCDCQKKILDLESNNAALDAKLSGQVFDESKSSSQDTMSPLEQRETKRRKTEKGDVKDKIEESELWTEKYQFKSERDVVTNNSQLERLKEWLSNWKRLLAKPGIEKPKKGKKGKGRKDESDSEFYDSDMSSYSTSENGRKFYANALLLSGPHGCGKTSSVYSIAKLLGFKVFEVNASSSRCKTAIIAELEGALNSHHVSNTGANVAPSSLTALLAAQKESDPTNFKLEKFFKSANEAENKTPVKKSKKRKNSLRRETIHNLTNKINLNFRRIPKKNSGDMGDSDEDADDFFEESRLSNIKKPAVPENSAVDETAQSVNIQRESLILFDEIDVIFKEDSGFWSAILHFVKRSKKPIVLTTTDEYLQNKMNLNVEKVDFQRPRVDASVRYLKRIAKLENSTLDTPTAYELIESAGRDMRRALIQLQMRVVSSHDRHLKLPAHSSHNTLELSKYLPGLLDCSHGDQTLNGFFFLDQLSRHLTQGSMPSIQPDHFKCYDTVVYKDGLSDSTEGATFNPFLPTVSVRSDSDESYSEEKEPKQSLQEVHAFYLRFFNADRAVEFENWQKHGKAMKFSFGANAVMNRFAQYACKPTSNVSLALDYRPILQLICRNEERKQQTTVGRRRHIHYLSYLNLGIDREDYSQLAKSSLAPKIESPVVTQKTLASQVRKSYLDEDLYSDGC